MKTKLLFSAAAFALAFSACQSGSKTSETTVSDSDSISVEELAPEPVKIDTTAIVAKVDSTLTAFLNKAKRNANDEPWMCYKLVSNDYFTPELVKEFKSLYSQVDAKCKKGGEQAPGVPMYVPATAPHNLFFCYGEPDGTDCGKNLKNYSIKDITSEDSYESVTAKVSASINQSCAGEDDNVEKSTVTYMLVNIEGKWLIDNIISKEYAGGSLRESVKAGKAVVRQAYI